MLMCSRRWWHLLGILVVCTAEESNDGAMKEMQVTIDKLQMNCTDKIRSGDDLAIHYTGTIDESSETGTKGQKFDSSYDRGSPFQFRIGQGQVIQGWDQGLLGLCEGMTATLVIPPKLGYGARGAGGVIPGGATLRFAVEVVSVSHTTTLEEDRVMEVEKEAAATKSEQEEAAAKEEEEARYEETVAIAEKESAEEKDKPAVEEAHSEEEEEEADKSSEWQVGDKAKVQWKRLSKLYPATITAVHAGSFDVRYDDGAQEKNIDSKYLHQIVEEGSDSQEDKKRISVPNEIETNSTESSMSSNSTTSGKQWQDYLPTLPNMGERQYRPRIGSHWHVLTILGMIGLVSAAALGFLIATTEESPAELYYKLQGLLSAGKWHVKQRMDGLADYVQQQSGHMEESSLNVSSEWGAEEREWGLAPLMSGDFGDDGIDTAFKPAIDTHAL